MNIKEILGLDRRIVFGLLIGFIAGFAWLMGIRFFIAQPAETHYHSNFAVYINGEREEFEEFTYYEEVAACTTAYGDNPKGRVHMHGQINDVIHVHDKRVTYGNFFQNIGWNVGSDYIAAKDKIYQSGEKAKVTYILNGEKVNNISSRIIGNLDKLLVSYGTESDDELQKQYETISDTAEETNKYQDPGSCGGLGGAGHNSFGNKLKRATFWAE